MNEEWMPVKGYEGFYEVSNLGRVKSHYTNAILQGSLDKDGYKRFCLTKNKAETTYSAHRLVMAAFVGECPEGMEVCHNDSNRLNNSLENLRYDTRRANAADRVGNGTAPIGNQNPRAYLSKQQVEEIKWAYSFGFTQQQIADFFSTTRSNINNITRGKTWSHL